MEKNSKAILAEALEELGYGAISRGEIDCGMNAKDPELTPVEKKQLEIQTALDAMGEPEGAYTDPTVYDLTDETPHRNDSHTAVAEEEGPDDPPKMLFIGEYDPKMQEIANIYETIALCLTKVLIFRHNENPQA